MLFKSLRILNYKLFEDVTLKDLKQVNVIIGKNNSGKSSLVDAIAAAYDAKQYTKYGKSIGSIIASAIITEKMARDAFGGLYQYGSMTKDEYAKKAAGKEISFRIRYFDKDKLDLEVESEDDYINSYKHLWISGLNEVRISINYSIFRRMNADRDIVPEIASKTELLENGDGATNLIRSIISESKNDEKLVEEKLLNALNEIFRIDGEFEKIQIQQISQGQEAMWEVFLQEKGKQRIALSQMGSGLKTIILILLNLLVLPKQNPSKHFVFAFEEIENNLHPALQRRVFEFIYKYAEENDITVFLTTHSHVAINCFYGKEQASIYHIEKKEGKASVTRIESYFDKTAILSDLDVKASDLLQSNGIIWVEGPSDRIYIKKWLEVLTENRYVEGKNYQFLYYGGRILSHYAAEEETELISILTTNRNAAIVIDSDKKSQNAKINDTKRRIVDEFRKLRMFSWVTQGKEIENYISADAIKKLVNDESVKQCGRYELFPDYIVNYYKGFKVSKVAFANAVVPFFDKDVCKEMLDLNKKITELYRCIEKWNE